MSLLSWMRKPIAPRAPRSRAQHHHAALRFRPQLEALEDRLVPSTLTVTSAADSGPGTLRAEIAAANPGDTINFAPSLNGQTITLTSGDLVLNKSLTIQGPGAGQLAISGGLTWWGPRHNVPIFGNSSRVFEVEGSGTNVTLSGLTITDGSSHGGFDVGEGGAILNYYSNLTVSGCTVSNNWAYNGGGIYNFGGSLKLVNSTLSGNVAGGSNPGQGEGGGLYSLGQGGTVSMTDCILSGNSANYEGGAVWMQGTIMTVNGCTVSGNSAEYPGAIDNYVTPYMLTVTDSVFSGNKPYAYGPHGQYDAVDTAITGLWTNGGGNTFS
jgi:hypothetical protein